jgi:hypothetical protein
MANFGGIATGLGNVATDLSEHEQQGFENKLKQQHLDFQQRQQQLTDKRLDANEQFRIRQEARHTDPIETLKRKARLAVGLGEDDVNIPPEKQTEYNNSIQRLSGMMPQSRFHFEKQYDAGHEGDPKYLHLMKYDSVMNSTEEVPHSGGIAVAGSFPRPEQQPTIDEAEALRRVKYAIERKDPNWKLNNGGLNAADQRLMVDTAIKNKLQLPVGQQEGFNQQNRMEVVKEKSKQDAKEYKLSSGAATMLENIDATLDMMSDASKTLHNLDAKGKLPSQSDMVEAWGWYLMGRPSKPELNSFFETVKLADVVAASSYLHGMRNYKWVEEIQRHLPRTWDDPKLMMEKMDALNRNMPKLRQKVLYWDTYRYHPGQAGAGQFIPPEAQDVAAAAGGGAPAAGSPQQPGPLDVSKLTPAPLGMKAIFPAKKGYHLVANPAESQRIYYQSDTVPADLQPAVRASKGDVGKPSAPQSGIVYKNPTMIPKAD